MSVDLEAARKMADHLEYSLSRSAGPHVSSTIHALADEVERLGDENALLRTTSQMPPDLLRVLRDPSVVVSQDGAVFELIAAWAKAPTSTASAGISPEADIGLDDMGGGE